MTTTLLPRTRTIAHTSTILPCLPENVGPAERDIYFGFIRALREGSSRRMEVRIMTAIHRAADVTDNSDAYVSRTLVDMGLMAPRLAFPGDFLDHVDATLVRGRPLRTIPASYTALAHHWAAIGEDLYALSDFRKGREQPGSHYIHA
jgi:hypothetical protein